MKTIKLGDFISEVTEKTTENNQHMVLTSSQEGIVSQDEYFNKQVASKDTTGYKIVRKGQFTYRAMSDTGRFYINQLTKYDIGIVSPAYPVFEVTENNILRPAFLQLFFQSDYFQSLIANQSTGSTRVSLKLDKIRKIALPVPSYEEQGSIVDDLAKLRDTITARRKQIEYLDELVKSRFIELFGSQCHNEKNFAYGKIDDIAEIYLGLTHTPDYIGSGVKFISAKNTSGDFLDLSDVKYISQEEFAQAPVGAKPRRGDVLFSRVGSNLGHPVILNTDEELCTFVSLGYLRTKGAVTNMYLKHWMRDDFFAEQVRRKVVGGGQPNLNTGWLKEFKIIIPPMELQEQFTAFVEQADKSKFEIQKSLGKLETLKKALMQKYFG